MDDEEVEKAEVDNSNLIELVNSQENVQVTGRVRGILKKLPKTYGGSILREQDMLPATKEKLELFFSSCCITDDKKPEYRVFSPYKIEMPQAIMRLRSPEVLESKRIIVRF